eukprot:scaffold27660_cov34-Tisochrysis_lutea.AAC.1
MVEGLGGVDECSTHAKWLIISIVLGVSRHTNSHMAIFYGDCRRTAPSVAIRNARLGSLGFNLSLSLPESSISFIGRNSRPRVCG